MSFTVHIVWNDLHEEILSEVSEIHYGYLSPISNERIAFESPATCRGLAINLSDIKEFEAIEEQ